MNTINKVQLLTETKGQTIHTNGNGIYYTAQALRRARIMGAVYTLIAAALAYVITVAVIV